ncbi:hypothetical protein BSKO_03512 [Bryopsis sp. KO-2023]|nr:hypothetical protein BSKO_03512 [Bryopsis sp. KO-2023]
MIETRSKDVKPLKFRVELTPEEIQSDLDAILNGMEEMGRCANSPGQPGRGAEGQQLMRGQKSDMQMSKRMQRIN